MPWTKKEYPNAMKNLPAEVRAKSIEIANALLDETNMLEGIAIATAISRAKDWAANRGKKIDSTSRESQTTDVKQHGKDQYVVPHESAWAVKTEGSGRVSKTFKDKTSAIKEARRKAHDSNASLTIQRKDGKVQQRISYNPNKKGKKQ